MTGSGLVVGFPGQGVSWEGVVAWLDAFEGQPAVARLRERTGVRDWTDVDPADTRLAQAAIFTASLGRAAVDPALHSDEPSEPVVALAGHSFGELAALVVGGVLGPDEGLELALVRGGLGAEVQAATAGAMLGVVSVPEVAVERLRRLAVAATGRSCEIAVRNHALQTVVSGHPDALDWVEPRAAELGGRAHRLAIGGPYHTPAMAEVAPAFRAAVAGVDLTPPRLPVLLSTTDVVLTPESGPEIVPDLLGDSLVMPVDWPRTLGAARALGAARGVDLGPGNQLARIGRRAGLSFDARWKPPA